MAGQGERPIDIIVAEKNPLLQQSLRDLFASDPRFHVAGLANDGESFLAALEELSCDVGVIGWELPFVNGRGILLALRGREEAPRMVVYTGSSDVDVPRQAMALGAAGFCSKNEVPKHLLETVVTVASGRMVFPFIDVSRLVVDPLADLTRRERELLDSLAVGMTNQQIATQTGISLNTVKFHLKNLYAKLGATNRAQAVAFFMRNRQPR